MMITDTLSPLISKRRAMRQRQITDRKKLIARHFDENAKRNYVPSPFAGTDDLIHEEENFEPWWCDDCIEQGDYAVSYELDHVNGRVDDIVPFRLCRDCAIENWDYIRDFD